MAVLDLVLTTPVAAELGLLHRASVSAADETAEQPFRVLFGIGRNHFTWRSSVENAAIPPAFRRKCLAYRDSLPEDLQVISPSGSSWRQIANSVR